MTLHIYISSNECRTCSAKELINIIQKQCQITKNYNFTEKNSAEEGFHIKIFNIDNIEIIKLWNLLKSRLNLKCAFVKKDNEYMGCILNWPNVFRQSACL
jgi:hypothetical protein